MSTPTPSEPKRRVVCAALRHKDIDLIVCGPRHFDPTMRKTIAEMDAISWTPGNTEQGFVDQFGVFMNRKEALEVAKEANQIVRRCGGDEKQLYSENLY